jgi:hypothetical protein
VIENDGPVEELRTNAEAVWRKLKTTASAP